MNQNQSDASGSEPGEEAGRPQRGSWWRLRALMEHRRRLTAFAVASAFGWGFLTLADEIDDEGMASVDRNLLLALRNPADLSDPIGPKWLEEAMRDLTALGGFTFLTLATAAIACFLVINNRRALALWAVATIAGGQLASQLLKAAFLRPRPALVPHESITYASSFPSGHAMMAATTFFVIALALQPLQTRRRAKVFLLLTAAVLTALVGASRVYLGVHWPTDVLGGWAMGALWAIGASLILELFQSRRPRADAMEA